MYFGVFVIFLFIAVLCHEMRMACVRNVKLNVFTAKGSRKKNRQSSHNSEMYSLVGLWLLLFCFFFSFMFCCVFLSIIWCGRAYRIYLYSSSVTICTFMCAGWFTVYAYNKKKLSFTRTTFVNYITTAGNQINLAFKRNFLFFFFFCWQKEILMVVLLGNIQTITFNASRK